MMDEFISNFVNPETQDNKVTEKSVVSTEKSVPKSFPASVYEDENEGKDRTKEDCACEACIIS